MIEYVPFADYILLRILESIPEYYIGRVLKVGPGIQTGLGLIPLNSKVDDIVLVNRHPNHWLFPKNCKKAKDALWCCREYSLIVKIEGYEGDREGNLFGEKRVSKKLKVKHIKK